MTVLSWRVEKGGQSLAHMIGLLHQYLHSTVGVLMTFKNAVGLRDAIVQARAEGRGETQLRTKLLVEKERYGNEFVARPFGKTVGRTKERKIKKEYLDFLNKLTSGSFSVETMEKKSGRTVAFQGLLSVRTVFHPEIE